MARRIDERGGEAGIGSAQRVGCGTVLGRRTVRANGVLSLRPGGCGLALRCVSGLVVVTQEGDRTDHELHPGDEFRTDRRGLVVAWALSESVCTVTAGTEADAPKKAA